MQTTRPSPFPGARPALAPSLKLAYMDIAAEWRRPGQLPVVYDPAYNIKFGGLEKLHPFDSCKFQKVLCTSAVIPLRQPAC
jgi:hypothetical protein